MTVYNLHAGTVFRMLTLMTHYRQPLNFSEARMAEAERVLRRFVMAATPCMQGPPSELLECLCNDMNTPAAIALMHRWRKSGDGEKLFAALRFLGFFECEPNCLPDEWKTLPADHLSEPESRDGVH